MTTGAASYRWALVAVPRKAHSQNGNENKGDLKPVVGIDTKTFNIAKFLVRLKLKASEPITRYNMPKFKQKSHKACQMARKSKARITIRLR